MKPLIRILANALIEAKPFVWRAKMGCKKHEQDSVDAQKWFEKYGELMDILKKDYKS